MRIFDKKTQVAFISYSLGAVYLADSLAQFPNAFAVKGDGGYYIYI